MKISLEAREEEWAPGRSRRFFKPTVTLVPPTTPVRLVQAAFLYVLSTHNAAHAAILMFKEIIISALMNKTYKLFLMHLSLVKQNREHKVQI